MAEELTSLIASHSSPGALREALAAGWEPSTDIRRSKAVQKAIQDAYGVSGGRLLSDPESQHKLGMGVIPSYGLTLYHHLMRARTRLLVVNSCPDAGDCVRVCVVNNNFGRFKNVQNGWRWRTELAAFHPEDFFVLLGRELRKAVDRDGGILFRPNINSDVQWEIACPALVDGSVLGDRVKLYGYTKSPKYLEGDGWVTRHYRVAYSWNEKSEPSGVQQFLDRGGNVAVVTDRRAGGGTRKRPVRQWADGSCLGLVAHVVDADLGDEWILNGSGTIGDLGFKPRSRELRRFGQESDFVAKVYDLQQRLFKTGKEIDLLG